MARILAAISVLAAVALSGCNTDQVGAPTLSVAPGQASLTVTRPSAAYGLAVTADVTVNGAPFAKLGNGDASSAAVHPGPTEIAVTCSCGGGARTIHVDVEPNQTYRLVVNPLRDTSGALAGAAGAALAGPIGAAAAQSGHERLPPFDIVEAP